MGFASVERIQELLPHLHGHARQRRCELLWDAQPPAMMIAVDEASGIAVALSRGCSMGVGGVSACMWSSRDDLTITAVHPLRISVRGALGGSVRL